MSELHTVFGAGALGYAVAEQAMARGHRARIVTRSGKAAAPAGAEVGRADLEDATAALEAAKGASVLYFCAAPPYTDWPAHYPAMQRSVVEAAARSGARLVTSENVYPYGRVSGPMTEDTPYAPCSKKGELRARLNEELLAATRAGTVKAALARGPDYYGPRAGVTTNYGSEVFGRAAAGKSANVFGDPDARHTFIYVDDFARGMVRVGERDDAMGQTWHMPCPPPLTQREMVGLVFRALDKPPRLSAMPGPLLTMLSWFMPIMRELREMEYQWRMDYDFRHEKFDRAFGGEHTAHERGTALTMKWFQAQSAHK